MPDSTRSMMLVALLIATLTSAALATAASAADAGMRQWTKGTGWGWVWGPNDEVGALNEMTDASRLAALGLVKQGKTYDLGVPYGRRSFMWPGHSPGEILSFRSPEGVARQNDPPFAAATAGNASLTRWHSNALFVNDNVGTQIDGLAHMTVGADDHWYNGFTEAAWGGDFGVRKADVITIPPVVARGVLIDVAGHKKVDALPSHYEITVADLQAALAAEGVDVAPGTVVLIRTGTARYWGEDGADHEKLRTHDSAGIGLAAAKWLVEQQGALMVGADTSGLEVGPANPEDSKALGGSIAPVHVYLLVQQGVHILELHDLEELAADRAWEFAFVLTTNAFKGTVSGTALRPLALR